MAGATDNSGGGSALPRDAGAFRALIANVPGAVYRCEPRLPWRISFISDGIEAICGYAAVDLRSGAVRWMDLIHPEDDARSGLEFERAIADGQLFDSEYRIHHRDGSVRWVRERGRATYDDGGAPLWVDGILIDATHCKHAEEQLRVNEERLRLSQLYGRVGTWDWDIETGREYWSYHVADLLGFPHLTEPTYDDFLNAVVPEDRPRVLAAVDAHLKAGHRYDVEYRIRTAAGEERWMRSVGHAERRGDGTPVRMLGIVQDVTEQREAHAHMELCSTVFANTAEAILVTDPGNHIIVVNQAFTAITGYAIDEVYGRNPRLLSSGRQDRDFYRAMWQAINGHGHWQGEIWNRRKNGDLYPEWLNINVIRDAEGNVSHHVGVFTDISERKASEARIRHLAHHDALTGLPNRLLLGDRLQQAMSQAERYDTQVAVLFVDLDRFKPINDTLCHQVGDELLREVARRLQGSVRASDTVARLGGDEFVVVLTEVDDIDDLTRVIRSISAALKQPIAVGSHVLNVSPSIGIAVYPRDGGDLRAILHAADAAMYEAKAAGRDTYRFSSPAMDRMVHERFALERDLPLALERGEMELHYQPVFDCPTGYITGAEAVLRWRHPERGLLPAEVFLPVAEDVGIVVAIGAWALTAACKQARAWRDRGYHTRISINLSARQFQQADLPVLVRGALAGAGLEPWYLELEVTENLLVSPEDRVREAIRDLGTIGVRLTVDDFGTGYSSIGHLRRLPVRGLKIERDLVARTTDSEDGRSIVEAILALARALDLEVTAKGVEDGDQVRLLRLLGCDRLQGGHLGEAVPADRFTELHLPR